MMTRAMIVRRVADLVGGRAVRWLPADRAFGGYDGRENTLEIFNVEAKEQRSLLRSVSPGRAEIERAIGGPLIVVFHTPSETSRLYPGLSFRHSYQALATSIGKWMERDHSAAPAVEPEQVVRFTLETAA